MPSARTTHRALTVFGLILALAMGALEATVIATAMPTVIGDLGGIHQYAWVANAYLLTSSVSVPVFGKLADIYGRKPIMLFGIAVFLLGSAASGASQSMLQLIVFRALQGLGAGAMQPMALTVAGDIFDFEERSRIQGAFGAAWGLFGLIGPMLGGFIVHHFSWRWVFYINIPFGVAAAALLVFALHERIDKRRHTLDFLGAALFTGAVVALLLATSRVGGSVTYLAALVSAALFVGFFAAERRAPEPVLPLALFARPVMAASSLANAVLGAAMMGTLSYLPLFVQGVLHGTPTDAGSAIAPMVIGWPIASAISGRLLPKVGFRPFIRLGLVVTAVAAIVLASTVQHDTLTALSVTSLSMGVGLGLASTALMIAVQTSVAWDQRGIATASTMFSRTVGGALAVGAMGGVLNASLEKDPTLPRDAASRVLSQEGLQALPPELVERLSKALADGLGAVFWIIAGLSVVGCVIAMWFPRVVVEADTH